MPSVLFLITFLVVPSILLLFLAAAAACIELMFKRIVSGDERSLS